jgi:hypothetical protein
MEGSIEDYKVGDSAGEPGIIEVCETPFDPLGRGAERGDGNRSQSFEALTRELDADHLLDGWIGPTAAESQQAPAPNSTTTPWSRRRAFLNA